MYQKRFVNLVKSMPLTLGVRMGRWAIYHKIPVKTISEITGARRQTIYNWMSGGEVAPSYRSVVERLLASMERSKTSSEAWSAVCTEFNLQDSPTENS
jgi:hypothetical protein